jgi:hypothetical protein
MMALAQPVDSATDMRYDPAQRVEEMTRRIRLVSPTITDTRTVSVEPDLTYSSKVHRSLLVGILTLLLSGFVSMLGLVSEVHWVSVLGAILLPVSLLFLTLWVERGADERKAHLRG